jgi:hypothetical protein
MLTFVEMVGRMKIGRKSLAKASLILFLTCFNILLNLNLFKETPNLWYLYG